MRPENDPDIPQAQRHNLFADKGWWCQTFCRWSERNRTAAPSLVIPAVTAASAAPADQQRRHGALAQRTSFLSMRTALVPLSIMSSLVSTPTVLSPSGSTLLASSKASELAKSWFEGDTASIIHCGAEMYFNINRRTCFSISAGWSPTGTRVRPGRSTRVIVNTDGDTIRSRMGSTQGAVGMSE